MQIGIIRLYFIGRTTFKCHQKGQNLENKSRYIQLLLLLLLLLLLRIRRPFSDPWRWCRASKTVSAGGKWSGLSFYVSWSSVPQKLSILEAKTGGPVWFAYGASLLRRRRRLRPFGPSQRLTDDVKFQDLASAFQKGKLSLSSSKTHHFRAQNGEPVWFVQMNLN